MGALAEQRRADHSGKAPDERGLVVVYPGNAQRQPRTHESAAYCEIAKRLAAIMDFDYGGVFDASQAHAGPVYFVPSDTFVTLESARELGIHGEQHLFGGVVPYPFIATKTITHPLPGSDAQAPPGWSFELARRVQDVVLPGFSAFSVDDALGAGAALLRQGAVRIKMASGIGGLGQWVVADAGELEACLRGLDAQEVERDGLVCERNLAQVDTLSVGQVRVGELLATYCGTQRLTTNNAGEEVYGGSDLMVVRGDFDALVRLDLAPDVLTAITQARTYHAAVLQCYPGMFASRCNYDVAQGRDESGRHYSGVLEQSWRIGGASGAEVAALAAFREDPALDAVRASTVELYGDGVNVPAGAVIYFQGVDEHAGPITKYSTLEPHANP